MSSLPIRARPRVGTQPQARAAPFQGCLDGSGGLGRLPQAGEGSPALAAVPGKAGAAPEIGRDGCLIPLVFSFLALCSLFV